MGGRSSCLHTPAKKEIVVKATGRALDVVEARDVSGFFAHCGYGWLVHVYDGPATVKEEHDWQDRSFLSHFRPEWRFPHEALTEGLWTVP